MPLTKPIEFGEGVSERFRTWLISAANRLFFQKEHSVTFTIPAISAQSSTEVNVTVTGVKSDDVVSVVNIEETLPAGVGLSNVRIKSDNTLGVNFVNAAGSTSSSKEVDTTILVFKRR